ncbi:MAG TPA: bifunctional phosphoribosylaminoimidazolecarboxamide formyltransferase/IMP cyclohydrolase, partial [Candidatus Limnocylindrales bacterium]
MRALLSVASRDGISAFTRGLQALDIEVYATDGTRDHLAQDGIETRAVSELTGSEAFLGGQVKTFHPSIYAGILARRDKPEQMAELEAQGIASIDLVAVNVKPFGAEVGKHAVAVDQAVEMIDVGGAALLSAAARNAAGVVVLSSPDHYPRVLAEIKERGLVSAELRAKLAAEAYATIAAYHAEIAAYLNQLTSTMFPKRLAMVLEKVTDLRYGENPHQTAAFYRETTHRSGTLADATLIQGGEPTFNNLLDLDAALNLVREFRDPAVVVLKHNNPCGAGIGTSLAEAFQRAYA